MKEIRKQKVKKEEKETDQKKGEEQPTWAEPEAAAHLPTRTGIPSLFFSFLFPAPTGGPHLSESSSPR
jgi:hypothetical protein